MGVKMSDYAQSSGFKQSVLIFTGIPLTIWACGDFPNRSVLKGFISIITILAFFQMAGLFFWTRMNKTLVGDLKMKKVVEYHKVIGYTFVTIMLFHPLFLVFPRFFEASISPGDALSTIITTPNQGIVLGIMAWGLMFVLGITSYLREKLPMKYTTWRAFHGILAMVFIIIASLHVIDLGRHSSIAMSIVVSILTASGTFRLLKTYKIEA